jgi:hypothetical protein
MNELTSMLTLQSKMHKKHGANALSQLFDSAIDRIAELEADNDSLNHSFKQRHEAGNRAIAQLEKERDIRDLEQQAKGIEDAVNKLEQPDVPGAPVLIINYDLLEFASVLRNKAKALKDQG